MCLCLCLCLLIKINAAYLRYGAWRVHGVGVTWGEEIENKIYIYINTVLGT